MRSAVIGELVEAIKTWNPSSRATDTFDYVDLSAVSQAEKIILSATPMRGFEAPIRARQLIQQGDILVSTVRPNLNGVAPVTPKFDGATASTGFCVLRPNKSKISSQYLMHWVQSPAFIEQIVQQATGASYPAVSDRIVKASTIPLPPLNEQRRIAAILDKADALRRKRKRALELLDGLTPSIFLNMFGNPRSNPLGLPIRKLGDLVSNESYRRIPVKSSDRDARQGKYRYYGASGVIDTIDEYLFDGRRLLIGEDGANLLTRSSPIAFLAEGQFWVNNHAHVLAESGECKLTYLRSYINLIDLKPYVTGSAQPKLTRDKLESINIMSPSLDMQLLFESLVVSAEAVLHSNTKTMMASEKFFASLQHRAFTGQL